METEPLTVQHLREALEHLGPPPGVPLPVQIRTSEHLVRRLQTRFPRSKTRRIRKKWAQRARNYTTVPNRDIYLIEGGIVYCHPVMAEAIRARMKDIGFDVDRPTPNASPLSMFRYPMKPDFAYKAPTSFAWWSFPRGNLGVHSNGFVTLGA